MKIRILTIALLAGCLSMSATAGFDQFSGPTGYMNVFEQNAGVQGEWLWGSAWGVVDLQALTTDDRTFELIPNIGQYAFGASQVGIKPDDVIYWTNSDDAGVTAGPDGNKWMDGNCFFERTVTTSDSEVIMNFDVSAYDLDSRYSLNAFIKVLDSISGSYEVLTQSVVPITATGSNVVVNLVVGGQPGQLLQVGFIMGGLNANPAADWGSATVTITALAVDIGDTEPPSPDPMTFATAPYALSDSAIRMTATTASDASGIEYYFTNVSGGGNDSGWQSGTTYVDDGLAQNAEYAYNVMARDTSVAQNTTAPSAASAATTNPADATPPSPDPMTITSTEVSAISVKVTATTATDESAVEYRFTCVGGAGHASDWQSSPVYYDSGLMPNSNYTYSVTARDLSSLTNTTAVSAPVMATTLEMLRAVSFSDTLTGYVGDSTQGQTYHELARNGWELGSATEGKQVIFNGSGATFGPAATWQSRNLVRTLNQDYGDHDFEAYATFVIEGTTEQAAFFGVGPGIEGNWGVPDFELDGVNAINAEIQYNWCKMWSWTNGVTAVLDESEGISTVTNRVKMIHDATAQTVTVSVDTDYDGVAFVEDRVLGTHSTVDVWVDAPQRIYIAAGAGVTFKDIEVNSAAPGYPIKFSAVERSASGMILFWEGIPGQVYEGQYTTDLISQNWLPDPSLSNVYDFGGSMTATSTVSAAQAFYRFIEK